MRLRLSSSNLVRVLLLLSFLTTLFQYFFTLPGGAVAPVALMYAAGFLVLMTRGAVSKLPRVLSAGTILFPFLILSEVASYEARNTYSIEYGLLLIGLFLSVRLVLLQIGFRSVLRVYVLSAIICTTEIVISGKKEISAYQLGGASSRFSGGSGVHPNLLSFTLVSYLPLFLFAALEARSTRNKLWFSCYAVATFLLLFLTGSRGSLGAAVVAAVLLAVRFTLFRPLLLKMKIKPSTILLSCVGLACMVALLYNPRRLVSFGNLIFKTLQLDTKERGIHSGFSGRTGIWMSAIKRISGLQWLYGGGFRAGYLIDDGYITLLFDNGLLGGAVILGSMLKFVYWLWQGTNRMDNLPWWRYRLCLLFISIIYLVNNVTTRYLFSFGNQFSLLIIFMMLTSREDLLGLDRPRAEGVARRPLPDTKASMVHMR